MPTYRYASYPSVKLYEDKGSQKQLHHLLWGDWVRLEGPEEDGWVPVRVRGKNGWMHTEDLQEERLLEVVFTDVGQGDGCLLITPQDKHFVIDAGVGDNMYRYLRWRYGGFKRRWKFEGAVITHPDQDHYFGFQKLFEEPNVSFGTVYHNGIMEERDDRKPLGPSRTIRGVKYLTGIIEDQGQLEAFLAEESRWRHPENTRWDKRYPTLLHTALTSGRVDDIRMLSAAHSEQHEGRGYLPAYGPDKPLSIEVLGPVEEPDGAGAARLRWFRREPTGGSYDKGKTKNGHSILLRLAYRDVSLLFGGDLNRSAETFLLQHYAGLDGLPTPGRDEQLLVDRTRPFFEADITKSCHHGSADFTDLFLRAVNAAATVVSSGDEESHAHPRSDTLGAIGRRGRGWRPLIFSTELMRSTREREPQSTAIEIGKLRERRDRTSTPEERAEIDAEHDTLVDELLKRNVTVYGAINLRTDGRRVVLAYMLERFRQRGNSLTRWDIYPMEKMGDGPLVYTGSS